MTDVFLKHNQCKNGKLVASVCNLKLLGGANRPAAGWEMSMSL